MYRGLQSSLAVLGVISSLKTYYKTSDLNYTNRSAYTSTSHRHFSHMTTSPQNTQCMYI